jgi:hypothetical protein
MRRTRQRPLRTELPVLSATVCPRERSYNCRDCLVTGTLTKLAWFQQVGRVVAAAPEEALLGLWFGLLRGCDDAMAGAIAAGKLPKVHSLALVEA